jgi:2-oxoglutarate ferredoxin oxidoreductase subunit alpha
MMEKVELFEPIPRLTNEEIKEKYPWATNGKPKGKDKRVITSLDLDQHRQEEHNFHLQRKYKEIEEKEVRHELIDCEDADYVIIAYGSSARIAQKSIQLARKEGIKVGLLRPITLWPFPKKQILGLMEKGVKGFLSVEMSAGQMIEDVKLTVNGKVKAEHFGRYGGVVHSPEEVLEALKEKLIGG